MKEMIYQAERLKEPLLLASGNENGYNYYVLSLGTHPTAYVELPHESQYFGAEYDDVPVECHGGLTYGRNYLHTVATEDEGRYFIGWDYAHYGDYVGYNELFHLGFGFETRYMTEDIIKECIDVIRQLSDVPDICFGNN